MNFLYAILATGGWTSAGISYQWMRYYRNRFNQVNQSDDTVH